MDALSRLVDALRCLPGVGPKSAQRMVFYLLKEQRQRGLHLAECLQDAMHNIQNCQRCNNYTTNNFCSICQNNQRDSTLLCIIETPADVAAIEQSNHYNGYYYVLMNKISPIDGIGPEDIGLPKLRERIIGENVQEVILALSPTLEGQTTIHFIRQLLRSHPVRISQLAHGIPSGGELEFLDSNTIGSALRNRSRLE
ncbi:recombination mediator RecR [Legionella londiniensis]|uniref:Recombination protein RecR n=1 Tax=Legionella londiniensis TaxID=45068 RepID=A0A0W0VTG9_9GAMM|nr:recombination mediator RecR [Legionella londiniensis]KTD23352.1 Recombination and repair protein recR [Legionella londiniensis]STX94093.1 Recombination and repair protein recR [Legionella londiniensis]